MQNGKTAVETGRQSLKKLIIELPHDKPLMDTNLKELKERTQRDIWTAMFLSSILDNSPKVEATQVG